MTAPEPPADDDQVPARVKSQEGQGAEGLPADQPPRRPIRARDILRLRPIWILPIMLSGILILVIAFTYIGSVVNPAGHLNGLPVLVVDQDAGATTPTGNVNFGDQVLGGLTRNAAVAKPLHLRVVSIQKAEQEMNKGADFGTLVIPRTFSASLLQVAGGPADNGPSVPLPALQFLDNVRLGSLGVSLASAVVTPAAAEVSHQISAALTPLATVQARANPVNAAELANPVTLTSTNYHPLPTHTALGLSAFYISLLTIMCGFLGATVVNSSIDAALGYGVTEIGPRYRQRKPLTISRWQTLLIKWAVAATISPLLTGLLLAVAAGILHMNAPHLFTLWLFVSLAAIGVGVGTLVLFAALGSIGQLVAMVFFIYLALASSGGTVPIQALPGFFRGAGQIEPLRLILGGNRSILYLGAQADAGLTHAIVVIVIELVVWLIIGLMITTWYDRRKLYRLTPDVLAVIERAVENQRTTLAEVENHLPPRTKRREPSRFEAQLGSTIPKRRSFHTKYGNNVAPRLTDSVRSAQLPTAEGVLSSCRRGLPVVSAPSALRTGKPGGGWMARCAGGQRCFNYAA